jgi:3-oxoacyl-[acyl-carrier-protein] synthase-3
MDKYGYTGSACIPMALDDAILKGKLKRGELLCFMGSGGGLAFANAIYRY